jgi:hypothetical protein
LVVGYLRSFVQIITSFGILEPISMIFRLRLSGIG